MSFAEFFARARTEAARYGPDPWIFVRELLQNARDAGASRVDLDVEVGADYTRVTCTDDGAGMSFEHARAYLFSLYASSKEADAQSVGKFGVGFWSILRFEPDRIWIRSRARGHDAWEIELAADSSRAVQRKPAFAGGTQVVLERRSVDPQARRRLTDAVRQNARFLRQRDGTLLEVFVQGERQNAAFELPPPVASFRLRGRGRRGGGRGVVSLGATPRVELFSNGLRVRAASCLEDLLSDERATSRSRVRFPAIEGIMAPQVLLEADDLEPLLSRSDARDDAQLRRLVARAQVQLRRLVRRQLDTLRPPGLLERVRELVRSFSEAPVWAQVGGAALFGALIAVVLAPLVWPLIPGQGTEGTSPPLEVAGNGASLTASYRDLSADYHGPQVSELDPQRAQRLDLRYAPPDQQLFFGLLVIEDFSENAGRESELLDAPYRGATCRPQSECVQVELGIAANAGPMRVPLPAGHRLDPGSLRFDGEVLEVELVTTTGDEAVAQLPTPLRGRLSYTTVRAPTPDLGPLPARALPSELAAWVPDLRAISDTDERVDRALALVKERVAYAVDATTAKAHAEARAKGVDFLDRALTIGAGDCDVQNGTLAAVLQATGVHARLVVGSVGAQGRARPWLHAWIEYLDDDGNWRVADASEGANVPGLDVPSPLAVETPNLTPLAEGDPASPTGVAAAPPGTGPAVVLAPDGGARGSGSSDASHDELADPNGVVTPRRPHEAEGPFARWWVKVRATIARLPPFLPATVMLTCTLALLGMLIWFVSRRGRMAVNRSVDLAHMLQGALRQPQAFRQLPELFSRRLIPQRSGRALSLMDARRLSAEGRLFWSRGDTALGRDAARRRCVVLDGTRPEAQAVAVALGAIDLDALGELEAHADRDPLLDHIEALLAARGARWRLRVVPELQRGLRSVDLRALDLHKKYGAQRLVYFDRDDAVLVAARRSAHTRPALAAFALLDDVLARLDIDPERRAELSWQAARDATLEGAS